MEGGNGPEENLEALQLKPVYGKGNKSRESEKKRPGSRE